MKRALLAKPNGSYDHNRDLGSRSLGKAIRARLEGAPREGWIVGSKPKTQGEAAFVWLETPFTKTKATDTMLRWYSRPTNNVGDVYGMKHLTTGTEIRFRIVERSRRIAPIPDGTPALKRTHRFVARKFGKQVRSGGRRACRNIAGTSTPSDHATLPEPAAEDWFANPTVLKALRIALVAAHRVLNLNYVICQGRIYSDSNNWKGGLYSGSCGHYAHLHVSVRHHMKRWC